MTHVRASVILTGLAALVLAACGTASAGRPPAATTAVRGAATPSATASAQLTNEQRAEQDAAAILAAFPAPPGTLRLASAPDVPGGVLTAPPQQPATPDLVDKASWWQAAGDPQQVLSWVDKHVPRRFTRDGSATTTFGNGRGATRADMYQLPAVPGVLNSRQLIVEVTNAGDGKTDIRVDAQVVWLPERPPGETIPAGTALVTLTLHPDVNVHRKPPQPVAVTSQAEIRQLAALVNGLPAFPAGMYSCPMDGGASLVLTFRAGQAGPVLAVATIDLEGCEGVGLVIGGRQQPGLGTPDGGRQVAARAVKLAGLTWNLASYLS